MVGTIQSSDKDAIILIFGDHGGFLTNQCMQESRFSAFNIRDMMSVLLAIKWPDDYDGKYDNEIHTLMDAAWYILDFMSADSLPLDKKPLSESYLKTKSGVYKVVEDGTIIDKPVKSRRE